jgi:hypothetical protein
MRLTITVFLLSLCCFALQSSYAQTPMDGKGVLIYTLRERDSGSNILKCAEWHLQFFHNKPTTGLPAVDKPAGERPEGKGPFFTNEQIMKFLKDEKVNWVAVRCADGAHLDLLEQFDDDLVKACRKAEIKILGWVRVDGSNDPDRIDKKIKDEAAVAAKAITLLKVDGLLVAPSPYDCYAFPRMGEKSKDYAKELVAKCTVDGKKPFIAYMPLLDNTDAEDPKTAALVDANMVKGFDEALGDKKVVIVPRMFWNGGFDMDNFNKYRGKLKKWIKTGFFPGYSRIILAQCERLDPRKGASGKPRPENQKNFSYLCEVVKEICKGDDFEFRGFGAYMFDGFLLADHFDFTCINKDISSANKGECKDCPKLAAAISEDIQAAYDAAYRRIEDSDQCVP